LTRQSTLTLGMRSYWVYIPASRSRGTLYLGMTNDLVRRIYEHREALVDGFSRQYGVKSSSITSSTLLRSRQSNEKRISNIGHALGRSS
jgi:predicted GIY-YIG superfamily endonuclease